MLENVIYLYWLGSKESIHVVADLEDRWFSFDTFQREKADFKGIEAKRKSDILEYIRDMKIAGFQQIGKGIITC